MVKISPETFTEVSLKLSKLESFKSNLDKILKDQTQIAPILVVNGLINLEMLRGFLVAYFCIEEELVKQEIADLENLVKGD